MKEIVADLKRRALDMFACGRCRETVMVDVVIPAAYSHTGETRRATKPIDACLAPLVALLNSGPEPVTTGSCCGHGRRDGEILLVDGRVLRVTCPPGVN